MTTEAKESHDDFYFFSRGSHPQVLSTSGRPQSVSLGPFRFKGYRSIFLQTYMGHTTWLVGTWKGAIFFIKKMYRGPFPGTNFSQLSREFVCGGKFKGM